MSKIRLHTLNDLYNYYSAQSKDIQFSANNENDRMVVQVPGRINFEESDDNTEGLLPVKFEACHDNKNLNGSFIAKDKMEARLASFYNRPILGYIHTPDGSDEPDFMGHNMHEDGDGNLVYDEVCVGIIPSSGNAHLEYDEDTGNDYVCVDGYIFEEYTKAAEILRRKKKCSVSVELAIKEMSFNAKEKYLNIEDFYFSGVTILGVDENGNEVKPGMAGSNVTLADFSSSSNSVVDSLGDKLFEALDKLNETLSKFNINNNTKEGGTQVSHFEELLEKYGKTVEDITFEYAELTDEELDAKFEEAFAAEPSDPEPEPAEPEAEPEAAPEPEAEPAPESEEKFQKTFELSHSDVRSALYVLLQSVEQADNEWYFIEDVYDDHFVYSAWDCNKVFGQKYQKDGDNVSFDGERYELHRELLTESEYAALVEMRSNYSHYEEIKEKLAKYEAEPAKIELLEKSNYSAIADNADFIELKKRETYFDMSIEDIKAKADEILLQYAYTLTSSTEPKKPEVQSKTFATAKKKTGRYGNLFSK